MDRRRMPKELFEQVIAVANSDFEENKDKFILFDPRDIFMFSYIHGFRDAFISYVPDEKHDMSEVRIGDVVTEIQSDILNISLSGAKKGLSKYDEKINSMELKEVYALGYQTGYQVGFDIYSDKDLYKKDITETIKYYHANFDRLH